MALMAVLRSSSRSKASMLDFWMKKKIRRSDTKTPTTMSSKIVKPCFLFMVFDLVVPAGIEPATLGL